jgi:hypothetical protein
VEKDGTAWWATDEKLGQSRKDVICMQDHEAMVKRHSIIFDMYYIITE